MHATYEFHCQLGKKSNIKEATSREVKPLSLRSSIQGYIFNKYLHKFRSKYVVLGLGFELLNPKAKQIPNWSPRLRYWKTRICIQQRALDIQQRISICFRTSKCVNIFTACMATLFVETLRHIHQGKILVNCTKNLTLKLY